MMLRNSLYSFVLLLLFVPSSAKAYSSDVLNIYAKTLPRILLMSSLKKQLVSTIDICLLHQDVDVNSAILLEKKIQKLYSKPLGNYVIHVHHTTYNDINNCKESSVLFLFNTRKNIVKKSVEFALKHQILTVAYDPKMLVDNVQASLFIARKVTPYLNIEALKDANISMNSVVLRVSKIFVNSEK